MNSLTKMQAKDTILNSAGKIFTIQFIKKNGEYRTMNARLGVQVNLKGGDSPLKKCDNPYLVVVYDMRKKQYRTINLETALKLNIDGIRYLILN